MVIYCDDEDRHRFLAVLSRVVDTHGVICPAYCLMANHYHLVLTTTSANLSRAVQQLNGPYGQWWNRRHARAGHVFQSRFYAQVIQDDAYMLAVCRYIVLNPVRARLVPSAGDWPWSSYCATAGMTAAPSFLRPALVWQHLASNSTTGAIRKYQKFVGARDAITSQLANEPVLGDAEFTQGLNAWRDHASREVPRRERIVRPSLESIFTGALTRAMRAERAGKACSLGYTLADVAEFLEVHPSTVSRMVNAGRQGVRPCKMLNCKT